MKTSRRSILGGVLIGAAGMALPRTTFGQNAATPAAEEYAPVIDPARFTTVIDNPFLPLTPGTTLVYAGLSEGGLEVNRVTTTDVTRVVMGVECVEVHDVVFIDGEVAEDTLDWLAQDDEGAVWYFGEASRDLEDGTVVSTEGSWEAGVDGAQPGIVMLAKPVLGVEYRQEYLAGEAEDVAKVLDLAGSLDVPYGSFDDVLITEDRNPLEAGAVEHKYYAAGIGLIASEAIGGDVDYVQLVAIEVGRN